MRGLKRSAMRQLRKGPTDQMALFGDGRREETKGRLNDAPQTTETVFGDRLRRGSRVEELRREVVRKLVDPSQPWFLFSCDNDELSEKLGLRELLSALARDASLHAAPSQAQSTRGKNKRQLEVACMQGKERPNLLPEVTGGLDTSPKAADMSGAWRFPC